MTSALFLLLLLTQSKHFSSSFDRGEVEWVVRNHPLLACKQASLGGEENDSFPASFLLFFAKCLYYHGLLRTTTNTQTTMGAPPDHPIFPPVEPAPQQTLSEFSVHENLPNGGHICFLSTVGKLMEIADFFTENVLRGEDWPLRLILDSNESPLS